MIVNGSDAWVGGEFTRPFLYAGNAAFPPTRIRWLGVQIHDGASEGQPDGVHPVVFLDRPRPPSFTPCALDQPMYPIDAGNLSVHDGES